MKNKIQFTIIIPIIICAIIFITSKDYYSYNSGAPAGHSYNQFQNNTTCTQCHSGSSTVNTGINITLLNDSIGKYIQGKEYNIMVSGNIGAFPKFGFELSAIDSVGNTIGTLAEHQDSTADVMLTSGNEITHLASSTIKSNGVFYWIFKWTAPTNYDGKITFNCALNAANNNGTNTGDVIYVNRKTIFAFEDSSNSIATYIDNRVSVYPNPFTTEIFINQYDIQLDNIQLLNSEGKLINNFDPNSNKISIADCDKGIYLLVLTKDKTSVIKKLIKY